MSNYNSKAKCISLPIQVYSLFLQPPSLACDIEVDLEELLLVKN